MPTYHFAMHWSIGAIFSNGVFKPDCPPPLREGERVHLEVQEIPAINAPANGSPSHTTAPTDEGRRRLIERLRTSPGYDLRGKYPSRDELHER